MPVVQVSSSFAYNPVTALILMENVGLDPRTFTNYKIKSIEIPKTVYAEAYMFAGCLEIEEVIVRGKNNFEEWLNPLDEVMPFEALGLPSDLK